MRARLGKADQPSRRRGIADQMSDRRQFRGDAMRLAQPPAAHPGNRLPRCGSGTRPVAIGGAGARQRARQPPVVFESAA